MTECGDRHTEDEIREGLRLLNGKKVRVRVAVGSVYVKTKGRLRVIQEMYDICMNKRDDCTDEITFDLVDVRCVNVNQASVLLGPGLHRYLPKDREWPEWISV